MPISVETLAAQPFLRGVNQRHLEVLADDALPMEFKSDDVISRKANQPTVST